jgi:hypothetical protein
MPCPGRDVEHIRQLLSVSQLATITGRSRNLMNQKINAAVRAGKIQLRGVLAAKHVECCDATDLLLEKR